jgi:hypothetical protein
VPESFIDVAEPSFRVLVELGYDRSIPPGEPTPARLTRWHPGWRCDRLQQPQDRLVALGPPVPARARPQHRGDLVVAQRIDRLRSSMAGVISRMASASALR